MSIENGQIWTDKETGDEVLILMVDDHYVYFQKDGYIKHEFKHDFVEQFERGEGDE